MSGTLPRFERGPVTFAAAEAIVGGQCVEARAASVIGVAAAGSLKFLGVARTDAQPSSVNPAGPPCTGRPSSTFRFPRTRSPSNRTG